MSELFATAQAVPLQSAGGEAGRKVVVVHRGARDGYQVAAALAEAGLLGALHTDLFWPRERRWAQRCEAAAGATLRSLLRARSCGLLPSALVRQTRASGLLSFALDKAGRRVPFSWRQRATRWNDDQLGRRAGEQARRDGSLLLAYSYYASSAFRAAGAPGLLFQLHPHPASVQRILAQELADHPDCAASLRKEWELALDGSDFERLVSEPAEARHILAASSFTKRTLVENGAREQDISVIPYGVDSERFVPAHSAGGRLTTGPLRLLFVGTITQRKGIKYLLEALRLLRHHRAIEVTVCGRPVDDLSLFKPFAGQVTVRPSVSAAELLQAYQAADLFVFPSVAEGFAQVLLEALACGLPVLSTTHTAAPDLVSEGESGFVVEPRRPDLLAARIEWALLHRRELRDMRTAARRRAEYFTPARFRAGVLAALEAYLERATDEPTNPLRAAISESEHPAYV